MLFLKSVLPKPLPHARGLGQPWQRGFLPGHRMLATVSDRKILPDPAQKYAPYVSINLPDRQWPGNVLRSAPVWLSTDLRDGNQALPNPMNIKQKQKYFDLLVKLGFKEIEIAYPSSSETEHNFTRSVIEGYHLPDDLWLQVLTPARPELIKKTVESVAGAKNVIIQLYLGTAKIFRDVVFQKSRSEIIDLAVKSTALIRDLTAEAAAHYGTNFRLNYGLEGFSQAEPEFIIELCEAVKKSWGRAGLGNQRIAFNLAASVEIAPPNHYADQVEYFCRNISEREKVIVSLHPHNDMGMAVAAAQLGLLAGADRVEGCLLGHGERTGNVDLITLALNQYAQGVSPGLDFSNLPQVLKVVEECTGLPVNPRFPYSGKLAFTAFSGSHQDAIRKGFQAQEKRHKENRVKGEAQQWAVPYLPFDPADVGCTYDALIRVNSQSGKAGVSAVLDQTLSLKLPRDMQTEFYKVIQKEAERTGTEVTARSIGDIFRKVYHFNQDQRNACLRVILRSHRASRSSPISPWQIEAEIVYEGTSRRIRGFGPDIQAALLSALGGYLNMALLRINTDEHEIERKKGGEIASYVQISNGTSQTRGWGVAVHGETEAARLQAAISAVNVVLDSAPRQSGWVSDIQPQGYSHRHDISIAL